MPNYRFDLKQGSDEWLDARLGIPTASEFDRIITPAKLELSKSARPFMCVKLAEWMAGAPLEAYDVGAHGWGKRGKDLEAEAIRYYEMDRDCETQAVGLVLTDDGMAGASPDRLINEPCAVCKGVGAGWNNSAAIACEVCGGDGKTGVGTLEMKCPALETHVGYMLDPQSLADEYRLQVQGQLWVCQREWADVMSYYPGFPAVIIRVKREDRVHVALSQHIPAFVETMLRCREKLTQMYGELRRERITAEQRAEASRAAFDEFMGSPVMRGVV